MTEFTHTNPGNNIEEKLRILERRVNHLESIMGIEWVGDKAVGQPPEATAEVSQAEHAESRIMEYGLAWLGSIVFLFGIVFLVAYVESSGSYTLANSIGYVSVVAFLALSYFLRHSFPALVHVLRICGLLLLYYVTLKLHFFTGHPLIANQWPALMLLLAIIAWQLYHAWQGNSEFLAGIAVTLLIATAIFFDTTPVTLALLTLTSLASLVLFYRQAWWKLHIYALFMVYLTHWLWLFGNPFMGHPLRLVASPQDNIIFLFSYAVIYASSIFIPKTKLPGNTALISVSVGNALAFSILLLIITPEFYRASYVPIFSAVSVLCLLFAVLLKMRSSRDFAPATYAVYGFMAMSIALYHISGLPDAYLLLVLQSFLVVSMALWFRSKIIVVANTFLFISILLIYLIASESIDTINFTFAFTALATARILNWQRERLTLKTEMFRNTYLLCAFFMILYSLNKALPSHYVTLAWTAAAFGFFFLSIWLHNKKYRYLSVLTIIVTGGHLFFVDLGQMSTGFRVIAFLVFALISIGVSVYYTKRIRKK